MILAAAGRIIERDGILGSIKDVAAEAGLGSTTVYRRFANREDLQSLAVAQVVSTTLNSTIAVEVHNHNPLDGLRNVATALAEIVLSLVLPECRPTDVLALLLADHKEQISKMLDRAKSEGTVRPDITDDDIEGITALLLTGLTLPRELSATAPRYVALIFDGLSRLDADPLPSFRQLNAQW